MTRTSGDPGYRSSHAAPGYGQHYSRTYSRGYYAWQWEHIEKPLLVDLLRQFRTRGKESLLDFACGTGRILAETEHIFPTTTGVDVSESMLEVCKGTCQQSRILRRDLTQEPLEENFDVVTSFRFFLNAETSLKIAALKAIRASLKPGGAFISNIHVNSTSPAGVAYRILNAIYSGRRAATMGLKEYRALLETGGFRIEDVYWYSYLPRTGPVFTPVQKWLMMPVENFCRTASIVPHGLAQSYLVVCARDED